MVPVSHKPAEDDAGTVDKVQQPQNWQQVTAKELQAIIFSYNIQAVHSFKGYSSDKHYLYPLYFMCIEKLWKKEKELLIISMQKRREIAIIQNRH